MYSDTYWSKQFMVNVFITCTCCQHDTFGGHPSNELPCMCCTDHLLKCNLHTVLKVVLTL